MLFKQVKKIYDLIEILVIKLISSVTIYVYNQTTTIYQIQQPCNNTKFFCHNLRICVDCDKKSKKMKEII
jgi:replication initiation and membrane attachment protein DnaB